MKFLFKSYLLVIIKSNPTTNSNEMTTLKSNDLVNRGAVYVTCSSSSYSTYTQVDQNGIVYDPKTDRKCLKNGTFTAVYSVNTDRFRSVSYRIIWRRNTCRFVSVS
jgi:hypothetical protein